MTAINTPLNASDVRVYYAKVDIAQGFADLRPGSTPRSCFWSIPVRMSRDSRWTRSAGFTSTAMSRFMTRRPH